MVILAVDDGSLQVDSQPKFVGFFWRHLAGSELESIRWTGSTLKIYVM